MIRALLITSITAACFIPSTASSKIYKGHEKLDNGKVVEVWRIVCTNREQDKPIWTSGDLSDAYDLGIATCGRGNFSAPPGYSEKIYPNPKTMGIGSYKSVPRSTVKPAQINNSKPVNFGNQRVTMSNNSITDNTILPDVSPTRPNTNIFAIIHGNGDYKKLKIGDNSMYRVKCTNIDHFFYMDGNSSSSQVEGEIDATCVEPD